MIALMILLLKISHSFGSELGVGFYGGKDFYAIQNMNRGFRLADLTEASISRKGFENPWMFGVNVRLNLTSNINLNLNAEAVYLKYQVVYSRNYPTVVDPFNIKTSYYDVKWGRLAFLATLEMILYSSKTMEFFAGLGGGVHKIAPAVSDRFLINTLFDKFIELDLSTDIKLNHLFGGHALVGMELNSFWKQIKIRLVGKYSVLPDGEYEEPGKFFTVLLGAMYHFNASLN